VNAAWWRRDLFHTFGVRLAAVGRGPSRGRVSTAPVSPSRSARRGVRQGEPGSMSERFGVRRGRPRVVSRTRQTPERDYDRRHHTDHGVGVTGGVGPRLHRTSSERLCALAQHISNVVPSFSEELTPTVPPCARTIAWTMWSPNPNPVVPSSRRLKGSTRVAIASCGIGAAPL